MGNKILKLKWHIVAFLRIILYKVLYGSHFLVGRGTTFRRSFSAYIEGDGRIQIGSNCFFNHYCSINALERIEIGDGCILGENVRIYDHNHRFSDGSKAIKEQGFSIAPVTIGNHCWFGSNVVVLKGCTIGNNCVIGAGCIISESIPDNTIVSMNRDIKMVPINKKTGVNLAWNQ